MIFDQRGERVRIAYANCRYKKSPDAVWVDAGILVHVGVDDHLYIYKVMTGSSCDEASDTRGQETKRTNGIRRRAFDVRCSADRGAMGVDMVRCDESPYNEGENTAKISRRKEATMVGLL